MRMILKDILRGMASKMEELLELYKQRENAVITADNCKEITGFELIELFQLSGLTGVHTDLDFFIKAIVKHLRICRVDSVVIIEAVSSKMKNICVEIYPLERKIFFRLLESAEIEQLVGLRVLSIMVSAAKHVGFERVMIQAAKYEQGSDKMWGYATWSKFGFDMVPSSHKIFLQKMRDNNQSARDVYSLVQSKEGYSLWCDIGFEWIGELSLNEESQSFQRFSNYIISKSRESQIDDFSNS